MSTLTTFDTTKEFLSDMLKQLGDGKTQLPDLQRGGGTKGLDQRRLNSIRLNFESAEAISRLRDSYCARNEKSIYRHAIFRKSRASFRQPYAEDFQKAL